MSDPSDKLFDLLPAVYRNRDAERGNPLRKLVSVLAGQVEGMQEDISGLYNNWFIETCDEWVVPYIGQLLGVRGLRPVKDALFSQRAFVANTLSYRRRKGTATMLEQLARDITGWNVRAVEFFQLLFTTQHVNHIRSGYHQTPDLRRTDELELLNSPFDSFAHTGEVRRIVPQRGRYNIMNIGLFLWRLQHYRIVHADAGRGSQGDLDFFTFHPLGQFHPLFNPPQSETQITHLAREINVPGQLRRRPLHDELEARRQAEVDGRTPDYVYFDDRHNGTQDPVFQIFLEDSETSLPSSEVLICRFDSTGLQEPVGSKTYQRLLSDGAIQEVSRKISVAVDPVLGLMVFPKPYPSKVRVSYHYGFSADSGGGPYNREASLKEALTRDVGWQIGVSRKPVPGVGTIVPTLREAILQWNSQPDGTVGVIAIMDNSNYPEEPDLPVIEVGQGSQLVMVAAGWPEKIVDDAPRRSPGDLVANELRPVLEGRLVAKGTAPAATLNPGSLVLNGLWLKQGLEVVAGNLGGLRLDHCNLIPGHGDLTVGMSGNQGEENLDLKIHLSHCISGPIRLATAVESFRASDSVLDESGGVAVQAEGTRLILQQSTVLGEVRAQVLNAENCIFQDRIVITRRQEGCMRFSFVPDGSATPRRYHCQPDLALNDGDPSAKAQVLARIRPSFSSVHFAHPSYVQLRRNCPLEIRAGAEDGSEMGAWNMVKLPQREANLVSNLDEYLRAGLEAGIFFVT